MLVVCRATGVAPSAAGANNDNDDEEANDGLPTTAYAAIDDVSETSSGNASASGGGAAATRKVFANVPTSVAATEAEDVGVEHLLRDVADDAATGLRTLSGDVSALAG